MHKLVKLSVLPAAAFALACGRNASDETPVLADDLKRDLQAAASASLELAATARDYQPTRVVSAIESPRSSAPVKRRSVRRPVAQPVASTEPEVARAPDPAPENTIDVPEPQPAEEAPAPAIDTPTNVAVSPRPTPVGTAPASTDAGTSDVGSGSGGGGLGGVGEAIGTIIGVVIVRGGAGGIDHCDPRRDGRGAGGPIALPNPRYPGPRGTDIIANNPLPMPRRPTFPARRF